MAINWYYILTVTVIACGGIPKGWDEGGYSASVGLPAFEKDFHLEKSEWLNNKNGLANRDANITSFGVLGAAFGSLIAMYFNDRLGRLWMWRSAAILWATGDLMQTFASGIYGFLLFARIWTGLGAGAMTAVSPMFLAEVAGAKARGMVVTLYMLMLLLFFTVGFFVNYGVEEHISDSSRMQYRIVQALPLIPVGLAFMASFLIPESPRWLAAKDRLPEAQRALSRIRGLPFDDPALELELAQVQSQVRTRAADLKYSSNTFGIIKDTFAEPTLRSRILLAWTMQAVAQWSGGQGISFYMPTIFEYAGVAKSSTALYTSGLYGLSKLIVTVIFAVVLVDYLGRRWCFMVGLFLEMVAHIYLAAYLGLDPKNNQNATNAAIAMVFVYAIGWSVGLCTVQFIYATEIFPTRIRSFAYCSTVSLHWFFQFAVVRVTPVMLANLDVYGTFVFFASVCAVGLVILGLWAPETKQVPLERMGELFENPWYSTYRARLLDVDEISQSKAGGMSEPLGAHDEKEAEVREESI